MATAVVSTSFDETAPQTGFDTLTALAGHASQLAGSELSLTEVVERLGSLAFYTLRATSLHIVLRNEGVDGSRLEEFFERRGASDDNVPEFVFSRRIAVRGVDYGQLELTLRHSAWSASALLSLAEILVEALARRAEHDALRNRNSALKLERDRLEDERQLDILLTRAGGILNGGRTNPERARASLAAEARRAGLPLKRYAERLLLGHTLRARALPLMPGLPLRRTA